MIRIFPGLIPASLCADIVARLDGAPFVDGLGTGGRVDVAIKQNLQLPLREPLARTIGEELAQCLGQSAEFASAARMKRMIPPRVNRYDSGMFYREHLDNALISLGKQAPIRADLAMTICLNPGSEYEDGELIIQADTGPFAFKGDAGDVILYPAGLVHEVTEVTGGTRLVAVSWLESQVRSAEQRRILFELDEALAGLSKDGLERAEYLAVEKVRIALVRMWSEP